MKNFWPQTRVYIYQKFKCNSIIDRNMWFMSWSKVFCDKKKNLIYDEWYRRATGKQNSSSIEWGRRKDTQHLTKVGAPLKVTNTLILCTCIEYRFHTEMLYLFSAFLWLLRLIYKLQLRQVELFRLQCE